MKFSIYGRFQLDIRRENDAWAVYRVDPGKRVRADEIVVPPDVAEEELAVYLDDIYHEYAGPDDSVELLA